MNFLAHALLAGADPALIAGGVAGDWIKGPLPAGLPTALARGVALHRAIDSHADAHPAFLASRARVSPERRRWSGVLVDIYYDHLLARDWARHHPDALHVFTRRVYADLEAHVPSLPEDGQPALRMMVREDWLGSYARPEGMAAVLRRMGARARQPNPLAGGEVDLLADMAGFQADFEHWLADARGFAAQWRSGCVASGQNSS